MQLSNKKNTYSSCHFQGQCHKGPFFWLHITHLRILNHKGMTISLISFIKKSPLDAKPLFDMNLAGTTE